MQVFADSFLNQIKTVLDKHCQNGQCCKASLVCQELGLDEKEYRGLVSAVIRLDALPEYRSYMGPGRGIGRKDTPPPKTQKVAGPLVPQPFKEELLELLPKLCANAAVVNRKKIVSHMTTQVEKNPENLVSAALKLPEFSAYAVKMGPGGGVYLKDEKSSLRPQVEQASAEAEGAVESEEPQADSPPVRPSAMRFKHASKLPAFGGKFNS